jgi:hypothetical protein
MLAETLGLKTTTGQPPKAPVNATRWDGKSRSPDGMRCTLPSYRRAQGTDKKETGNEEG